MQSGRLAVAGELAAGAVHQINNPLFAILTLTGFLLRDVEPGTQAHERLQLVSESANEIKEVVERLHHFVRERSQWALVALDDVAHEAAELVRWTSAGKQNEIVERYPPEPASVHGSAAELRQAFVNLLLNAVQAMPRGGTASLEVAREGEWVVARVGDEGDGIPEDALGRVFEAFHTTRNGSGTGLGLPASRAIAELHGGTLEADLSSGPGARLVLRLPAAEEDL